MNNNISKADKEKKLAQKLKENLMRRKAQIKQRKTKQPKNN